MDEFPLAVVTGGAHRLGRVFATTLARKGYAILLHYHSSIEQANQTTKELQDYHVPVYPVKCDLTTDIGCQTLFSEIDACTHRMEVLVNSAAIMTKTGMLDAPADSWDATFDINLRVPFILGQQASKRMAKGGLIVNVSDAGAHKLWTKFPAYVVSKGALEHLTRLQAKAYGPTIRVNAIAPGLVLPSAETTSKEWDDLVSRIPLQRPVSLDEISAALSFLVDNTAITGEILSVDAGYSLV